MSQQDMLPCTGCGRSFPTADLWMSSERGGDPLCEDCLSRYVIRAQHEVDGDGTALYWCNEAGWVDRASATVFTALEARTLQLPLGAAGWELIQPLWSNDLIQFARLLCEIMAVWPGLRMDVDELCQSMDLPEEEIQELLDRAHVVWERSKKENCP